MSEDPQNAPLTLEADLAFMRSLVSEGGRAERSGGIIFLGAGLIYGFQCLVQWANCIGWLPLNTPGQVAIGGLPTVALLILVFWVAWDNRKKGPGGVATRAINAAYSSAGIANVFMVFAFGYNAIKKHDFHIWLYYGVVVCAIQGAVWYIAYMIRRKLWLAGVSAGWFVATVAAAVLIDSPHYVLVLGLALFILMGGSGYIMIQQASGTKT